MLNYTNNNINEDIPYSNKRKNHKKLGGIIQALGKDMQEYSNQEIGGGGG